MLISKKMDGGYNVYARKNMGWDVISLLLVYLTIWFVYVAADLRAVFVVRYIAPSQPRTCLKF